MASHPRWGLENPDAMDITVSENLCCGNSAYGIAVSGRRIQVSHNQVVIEDGAELASGILCNASLATLTDNSIVGPGQFGIDAGGSADTSITSNLITNCAMGINAGGSARIRIAGNKLVSNTRAVTLFQVETDGQGSNFGQSSCDTWIEDNLIQADGRATAASFCLMAQSASRLRATASSCRLPVLLQNLCWAHTDSVWIHQNILNGSPLVNSGSQSQRRLGSSHHSGHPRLWRCGRLNNENRCHRRTASTDDDRAGEFRAGHERRARLQSSAGNHRWIRSRCCCHYLYQRRHNNRDCT